MATQDLTPKPLRILLVEDDPAEAHWLTQLLENAGPGRFEIRPTSRLDEALRLVDEVGCDLLLLDLFLPDSHGFDTFTRAYAYAPTCPIIVLSGIDDEALAMRAVHEGAQDYLVKRQIDGRLLTHAVRYAIERHRVEQALARERDLLHTLLDTLPDRVYFKDRKSQFIRISRALAQLFGLTDPRQAAGKTDFDFFTPEHAAPAFADEQEVMRTGKPLVGKIEQETLPDGRVGWALTTKVPLRDAAGRLIGTFGLSRDITDLKKMEDALAAERELLRGLVDSLPDHIYVKDLQSRFIVANTALQRFFRAASSEEVIGKSDFDFFPREAAQAFRDEEKAMLETGESLLDREARFTDGAGRPQWILTTKFPLRGPSGAIIGLVGINRDMTAQKLAEEQQRQSNAALAQREQALLAALAELQRSHEQLKSIQLQLVQAEKMESIGRLAAGIAHEVKNPLAIILMGIDYLSFTLAQPQAAPPEPASAEDSSFTILKNMKDAVRRADNVIRGLLDFSAPRTLHTAPASLNQVIQQALQLVRHELVKNQIEVRSELSDSLPRAALDESKMEQVFVNLFINAAHAMPSGGTLTVRTRNGSTNGQLHDGGSIIAEVDDTGVGIPAEKLAKVFDPFFTTKSPGKGTGLGLSVSKTIVEMHGGRIDLRNRPEGGVRATLVFGINGRDVAS